jgi:hypothetical protein
MSDPSRIPPTHPQLTRIRAAMIKFTDERVKWMNEVLQGIKAVKLHSYEDRFTDRILAIRNNEVSQLTKRTAINVVNQTISAVSPIVVSVVSLTTYALLGNEIKAEVCFPAIALFGYLRFPLVCVACMASERKWYSTVTKICPPLHMACSKYSLEL